MIRAAASRISELLLVLFGASVLTFLMVRLVPGDAAQVMLGAADVSPEKLAAMRHTLGLDESVVAQYGRWIWRALHGDLGTSVWTGALVTDEILGRVGVTAELTLLGLAAAIAISVPAGCVMATMRSSAADVAIRMLSILGVTVPSFWLGAMLLYGAGRMLPGVPLVGWVPFGQAPWTNLGRLILPVTALALPVVATLSRILRAAMVDALEQDFVRTARAKGVSPWAVVLKHALRNALIPYCTSVGIMAGYLFGGSVVIEQVFALPGLGRLMVGAIAERNYPLIQGVILLATSVFVAVNMAVDVLALMIDPRTRRV
jgi:peptide/nickel transport system permease protein